MTRSLRSLASPRRFALAALLAATLTSAIPPLAAAPEERTTAAPQQASGTKAISLEFNGGTLASLLDDLRRNPDQSVNLLVDQKYLNLPVPAFSIREAHPDRFMQALGMLLNSHRVRIETGPGSSGTRSVYVLVPVSMPPEARKEFVCFALGDLDPTPGVEAVADAVRVAWKLDPAHRDEDLRIQFHPGTKMLLAHGSKDAMVVVDRVVGALLAEAAARKAEVAAKAAKKVF